MVHKKFFYVGIVIFISFILIFFVLPFFWPKSLSFSLVEENIIATTTPVLKVASHVKTPEAVKGIYMTACVASMPSFREKLVKLINETELNSVIIDIKDYTGTLSFDIEKFKDVTGPGCWVKDMREFVEYLHTKNIYVIGRVSSFQDSYMTKTKPYLAVKKASDKNVVWKDRKGISFVDANAKEMWDYLVDIGKESYAAGFDEINFDYIRFPSDGNMKDIYFPYSNDILIANVAKAAVGTSTPAVKSGKSIVMKNFFDYLHNNFGPAGIPISADLFGMTATNYDDLNIGQVLEDALVNFDYVAPMVYPSHYPVGFNGWKDPNKVPYEIVKFSMEKAVERAKTISVSSLKLRPWLQDNDYPVPYSPAMVRAQITATYDSGLTSWMLWDAANTYTKAALETQN